MASSLNHNIGNRRPVNILLVDDQHAKLLSYEAILKDLDENLITAMTANEALGILLKTEVAVILVDVCMPELDGFAVLESDRSQHVKVLVAPGRSRR